MRRRRRVRVGVTAALQPRETPEKSRRDGLCARKPQTCHSRQGANDRTGELAPIPRGGTPIVADPGGSATPLAPPAIEDDLNARDRLEGPLDLGEKEGTIGRDDRIAHPGREEPPRARGADPVRHPGVSRLPLHHCCAAPRADDPHMEVDATPGPLDSQGTFWTVSEPSGSTSGVFKSLECPGGAPPKKRAWEPTGWRRPAEPLRCLVLRALLCYPGVA
jgi:hypothetical protein